MKKNKKSSKRLLIFILTIVLLVGAIHSIFIIIQNSEDEKINNLLENIEITTPTEGKTERMMQIDELKKENQEIVGWIEIPDTGINYPVLQGTDNDYYMTHDYKKKYTKNGSIFLDKSYDWNLPSTNLLLYGHNNRNGTMFEELLNYKEESYYKNHPTIRFTTNTEDSEYEIIAVFLSRVYYKSEKNVFRYYYFINAENEEEFNDFVKNSKNESLYDTGKTAEYGDQLLTLSTCSYHTEDGRFAVVARKVK